MSSANNTSVESMTSLNVDDTTVTTVPTSVNDDPPVVVSTASDTNTVNTPSDLPATDVQTTTPTSSQKSNKSHKSVTPASIAKKLLSVDVEMEQELKALRTQVKGMEILLQQNAALEKEVERLCSE